MENGVTVLNAITAGNPNFRQSIVYKEYSDINLLFTLTTNYF